MDAPTDGVRELPFPVFLQLCALLDQPNALGHDWREFAQKLGFKAGELLLFDASQDKTKAVLTCWHMRNPNGATVRALKKILKDMERNDVIAVLSLVTDIRDCNFCNFKHLVEVLQLEGTNKSDFDRQFNILKTVVECNHAHDFHSCHSDAEVIVMLSILCKTPRTESCPFLKEVAERRIPRIAYWACVALWRVAKITSRSGDVRTINGIKEIIQETLKSLPPNTDRQATLLNALYILEKF